MGKGEGGGGIGKNQQKIAALEGRADETRYPQHWETDLANAFCAAPGYCCYATLCCYCASFQLRRRALYNDMSRYVCCGGICPCSGKMGEKDCPNFCLAMEVFCCFAQSVATTRWMIQDEFRIHNTKCDNCIIGTMVFLQYLSCVCSIVACLTSVPEIDEAAQCVDCLADVAWCTVCGCMQTQAKKQLDLRDKGGNPHARDNMAPPMQQHMQLGHMPNNPYHTPQGPPHPQPQPHHAPPPGYPAPAHAPPPGYPAPAYAPPPGAYNPAPGAPPPGYPRP